MSFIDEISPSYYGEDRLRITLADANATLRVFTPVRLSVDYSRALPEGIVLPLEFTVTSPSNTLVASTTFRRFAPSSLIFTPREGGSHLVRLAESFHNHWFGRLVLEITGDRLTG